MRDVKELFVTNEKLQEIKAELLNDYILKNPTVNHIDKALQKIVDELSP